MGSILKNHKKGLVFSLVIGFIAVVVLSAALTAPMAYNDVSSNVWKTKTNTSLTINLSASALNVSDTLHVDGLLKGISGISNARVDLKITTPNGSVTYPVNGQSAKTDGKGNFKADFVAAVAGVHNITATYSGNMKYSASNDVESFTARATASGTNNTPTVPPKPTPTYDFKVAGKTVYGADGGQAYNGSSVVGAINWAIANAPVKGVVLIAAGSYNINGDINIQRSQVTLMGETGTPRVIPGTTLKFTESSATNLNFTTVNGIRSLNADNFVISNLLITGYGTIKLISGAGVAGDRYNIAVRDVCIETTLRPFKEISAFTYYATDGHGFRNISYERCISLDSCGAGFIVRGDTVASKFDHMVISDCLSLRAGLAAPRSWNWGVGFDVAERNTINDVVFMRCEADYSFESGFHWEDNCPTTNCKVYDCVANYNGQKPADFPNNEAWHPYGPGFGAGFLYGGPNSKGITMYNCTGVGNTMGFYVNK